MTAAEAADALRATNLLLESWRLESLLVYAVDTLTLAMTGAASYTIGPGGSVNTTRPVRLELAALRLAGSPSLDIPIHLLSDEEYQSIALKGLTGTWGYGLYYDRAYPLGSLFPYPVYASGSTLVLYPWHPLSPFAGLSTDVALPPGYERALQKNLAIELSPGYRDCVITPALAQQAEESLAVLKLANTRAHFLHLPAGIPTGRRHGMDRSAFQSGGTL